jgi:hypothetical protein
MNQPRQHISFPNTGGTAVSSYTLPAYRHRPRMIMVTFRPGGSERLSIDCRNTHQHQRSDAYVIISISGERWGFCGRRSRSQNPVPLLIEMIFFVSHVRA